MRTRNLVLAALPLVAGYAGSSSAEPALSLHFGPTTYPGCVALSPDTLTCSDIIVDGLPGQRQRLYVLVSGVETTMALQFGVTYPPTVDLLYWQACGTSAVGVPESTWPASGSGLALAWSAGLTGEGSDSIAVVGYFEIGSGSEGVVELTDDPRNGTAAYVDPAARTFEIPSECLGAADVTGEGGGSNPCGTVEWAGGLDFPQFGGNECNEDLFSLTTPFPGYENEWDCGAGGIAGQSDFDTVMVRSGDERIQALVVRNRVDRDIPEEKTILTLATAGTSGFHTSENEADSLEAVWINEIVEPLATADLHPRRRLMALGQTGAEGEDVIVMAAEGSSAGGREIFVARIRRSDGGSVWERRYTHPTVSGDHYVGGIETRGDFAYIGASVESSTESRLYAFAIRVDNGNVIWVDPGLSYPLAGGTVRVADVVLDYPRGFYVAGRPETVSIPGPNPSIVLGFDVANGSGTFCRVIDADEADAVQIDALEVDELGDLYVAGRLHHPDLMTGPCLFVARDLRYGGGSSYFTVLHGSCSQAVELRDFLVTDGGVAYVLDANAGRVWRADVDGSTRWATAFPCTGDLELIQYSQRELNPLAGVLLVAGSFLTPDIGVCDEQPCTYVFALDHHDGDVLGAYATALRTDADSLRSEPGALAVDDLGVWVASEVYNVYDAIPSRDVLLSGFTVWNGTVAVGPVATSVSSTRLRAWAVGRDVLVDLAGAAEPAQVRLFDVAGRLVGAQEATSGTELVRFTGIGPGIFFVDAARRGGHAVTKVAVVR